MAQTDHKDKLKEMRRLFKTMCPLSRGRMMNNLYILDSAHPQMANLPDFGVSLKNVILQILKCIPAVTTLALLELEQIFSFVDEH